MSDVLTITGGGISASISTFGAELVSLKNGSREYMRTPDRIWMRTAPVLFPICGRLKDGSYRYNDREYSLPIHGFASSSEFTVKKHTDDTLELMLTDNDRTFAVYPFRFYFTVSFCIADGKLAVLYTVKNNGDDDMYFSVGCHEGYSVSSIENCTLLLSRNERPYSLTVDGNGLLDGGFADLKKYISAYDDDRIALRLNDDALSSLDTVILKSASTKCVELCDKGSKKTITVESSGLDNLLFWKAPGSDFLCIEMWSGLPDTSDCSGRLENKLGITRLGAGEQKTFKHIISVISAG